MHKILASISDDYKYDKYLALPPLLCPHAFTAILTLVIVSWKIVCTPDRVSVTKPIVTFTTLFIFVQMNS